MMLGLSESPPSSAISIRRPYSETPSPRQTSPLAQTTDRRVANVVGPSDVRKHFSCLPASNGFASLMAGELGLTTKDPPLAFARSRPSPVLVRISSRSNSASPPNKAKIGKLEINSL